MADIGVSQTRNGGNEMHEHEEIFLNLCHLDALIWAAEATEDEWQRESFLSLMHGPLEAIKTGFKELEEEL